MGWFCVTAPKLTTLVTLTILLGRAGGHAEVPPGVQRRFDYKLSFKGPHLVQSDGTIPFWDHFGDAIASDESVRITPSLKSKKGSVWSKNTNTHDHWEVEVVFRVTGRGRIGADGLAVWYTEGQGQHGSVFGSADQWKGLGVFFDSYDNDVQNNNPYIMIILNDGTQLYNHDEDGTNQILGGCMRDFRNKPYPTRAKIEYYNKALTIFYHNGVTSNKDDFEICTRVENIELPTNGYFGVSAATGGLADDHDVFAFLTHGLVPPAEGGQSKDVSEEERTKFEKEYNEYQEKLDKAREEYKKEHPTKPGEYVGEEEKMYEAPELRELKMILDGQNDIYGLVKSLVNKLDEIVGRQERQLSLLTTINQQPRQGIPIGQQNTMEKQEVAGLISSQQEVANHIREVRSVLGDVQLRVSNLGQGNSGSDKVAEVQKYLQDVKSYIATVLNDLRVLGSNQQVENASCPTSSCVTPVVLFVSLLVQLGLIIAYLFYRARCEAAAKKFY